MSSLDPVLVIAGAEHPGEERVWGTGGWTPPEYRRARDWLTLCRLLGWGVGLAKPDLTSLPHGLRWLIVACAPEELAPRAAAAIAQRVETDEVAVIAPAGTPLSAALSGDRREVRGKTLRWSGPGEGATFELREELTSARLEDGATPWLWLDDFPIATARPLGRGVVVTLGFDPSAARDAGGGATVALRRMLLAAVPAPGAWVDHQGVLALRMDDPGFCQNVHCDRHSYRELDASIWDEIAGELRSRGGRLSVAVVPGWADDGDPRRGELRVGGAEVDREGGRVHPSWRVVYRDASGRTHDYAGEFDRLRELAEAGIVNPMLHGYTHVRPPLQRWAAVEDRHEAVEWYREFGDPGAAEPGGPLDKGYGLFAECFDSAPTTLVFPGDEWTNPAIERALDLGIEVIDSYYLALRDGDRFCWCEQVCSPYLDEPDPKWLEAGLPVVGYFHARDIALHGVDWFRRCLDAWQAAGATRFTAFDHITAALRARQGLLPTA